MNLRGGRNAEIKSKLKDIRDYVKCLVERKNEIVE